jgi:hypothetical protein
VALVFASGSKPTSICLGAFEGSDLILRDQLATSTLARDGAVHPNQRQRVSPLLPSGCSS